VYRRRQRTSLFSIRRSNVRGTFYQHVVAPLSVAPCITLSCAFFIFLPISRSVKNAVCVFSWSTCIERSLRPVQTVTASNVDLSVTWLVAAVLILAADAARIDREQDSQDPVMSRPVLICLIAALFYVTCAQCAFVKKPGEIIFIVCVCLCVCVCVCVFPLGQYENLQNVRQNIRRTRSSACLMTVRRSVYSVSSTQCSDQCWVLRDDCLDQWTVLPSSNSTRLPVYIRVPSLSCHTTMNAELQMDTFLLPEKV